MASALHFIVLLCGLWIGANVTSAQQSGCPCPCGWTKLGSRCFKFFNTPKNWADAERHCTGLDGNLASVLTKEEGELISKMVETTAWVGGYDETMEGVWLWNDGSKFDFKMWAKGEPNNLGDEGCMEFGKTGDANDLKCDKLKDFVCAKTA